MLEQILFLVFAAQMGLVWSTPTISRSDYDSLTSELKNIEDYLEKLRVEAIDQYFPNNDFRNAAGKMLLLVLIVEKGLEKLEYDVYAKSLKKAENLEIEADSCIGRKSISLYAKMDVVARVCKNNYSVEGENFFTLYDQLEQATNEARSCLEKDEKCIQLSLARLKELVEGKTGLYSPEYKEYVMNTYVFATNSDIDCLPGILKQDNFIRREVLKEGEASDECIRNEIEKKNQSRMTRFEE